MSPFSAESAITRTTAIERFRAVVDGADDTGDLPDDVRAELPEILWWFHMGLILFWVHDRSPEQIATRLAVARLVPIVTRAIRLVDVPELHALVTDVIALLRDVRSLTT
jgi:hypothetical protein